MARPVVDGIGTGPPGSVDEGGWGGAGGDGWGASRRASFTALLVLLAASTMVFAALSSAFAVRRSWSNDWAPTPKPAILWWNTLVLLASSVAIEVARRALHGGRRGNFNRYWTAGTVLGLIFLVGQAVAWLQLSSRGFYVSTNPSSSFFYVLTATHALHLLGAVGALLYVNIQALRLRLGPGKRTAADFIGLFWHFLDGLWVYLMVLLYVWG